MSKAVLEHAGLAFLRSTKCGGITPRQTYFEACLKNWSMKRKVCYQYHQWQRLGEKLLVSSSVVAQWGCTLCGFKTLLHVPIQWLPNHLCCPGFTLVPVVYKLQNHSSFLSFNVKRIFHPIYLYMNWKHRLTKTRGQTMNPRLFATNPANWPATGSINLCLYCIRPYCTINIL